jgi:uncharacterized protein (PEP-CTERM system associated)
MDITMVQNKTKYNSVKVWPLLSLLPLVLPVKDALAAETQIIPELKSSLFGYQLERADQIGTDEGAAWQLSPSIVWSRQSVNMQTRVSWQHDNVLYKDEQRENRSFNEFSFANRLSLFRDRLAWELNASQSYRVRDTQQGIFSDTITGADNLSKIKSYGSGVSYRSLPTATYRIEAQVGFNTFESDSPLVDDNLQDFMTDTYNSSWLIGTNQRGLNFFWQYSGRWQNYERSSDSDASGFGHNLEIGVPIAPKLSVIGRAGTERFDNNSTYDNDFEFFGAGVEYRFGARSRVNVTMNRSDSQLFGQKQETDTYVALDFLLAPTRRTSLEGSFDRRYFGRTLQLSGNYDLRFLSLRLKVSDVVRTQNAFDREFEELGIFVCPDGSNNLAACFKPPTDKYVPVFGESLQQVNIINTELREEIVEVQSAIFSMAYSKNRLNLGLTLSEIETQYVETGAFNINRNVSLKAGWKLSEQSSLQADMSFYQIDYRDEAREDDNLSVSVSYQVTLSQASTLTLTARRLDRDSSIVEFDNSENRLWLDYRYRF